jgi:sugar/nucleoside kinase (ribokinase family)
MAQVLGIGNALVDILIRLEDDEILHKFSLPKGSMQLVDKSFARKLEKDTGELDSQMASGGSAANTVHGLARLGIVTGFIGKVGNDTLGKFFREDLERSGIKPVLFYGKSDTGRAVTLISPDSERTFAVYLGAAMEQQSQEINCRLFKGYEYLHIEGYLMQNHDLIEAALKLARENNLKISLDLASYNVVEENLEFLKLLVSKYVNIIFANEEEAKAFTGKDTEEALSDLSDITDIAVVKTGETGSMIKRNKEYYKIGIVKVNCIDTTGAGDLYAAGFLYGLINNLSLRESGEAGALLSGKVIENIGAKISDSKWKEISNLL